MRAGAGLFARKLEERAALETANPDAPWLWRPDWAAGRMEDGNRLGMWTAWGFALFWNLVSLPGAVLAVRAALEEGKSTALIALIFPVVGIGLLAWAVRATLRYGVSVLELRSTQGVVGRSLAGAVRTTSLLHPTEGFQIQLTSLRRTVGGGGKHRSTSETILWQESKTVRGQPSRTARGMSTAIPFAFAIPGDVSRSGSPVFPVIFGLFALLMLWGVPEMWLRTTRVSSDGNSVVVASGYLVPSGERRFSRAEIAGVRTKIGMRAGETAYYDLQLRRADGKAVTVGHGIRDKREAEWLAATLSEALGLVPVSATGGPGSRTR